MLSAKQIQNSYIKLYKQLREYIWPYEVVKDIANLEISCFQTFPSLDDIKLNLSKLKQKCLRYLDIDDDQLVLEEFDDMSELLDSEDTLFAKIQTRSTEVQ